MPRTLNAFIHVSLDGYYCDAQGNMGFAHKAPDDAEWNEFTNENAKGGGTLLFGRVTYQMMAAWWPSPMAAQAMPTVAERMNAMPKVVFSRTMASAEWANTTLVKDDLVGHVQRMKQGDGPGLATLGSGTLVRELAAAGLIDTLQVVVNPVAIGGGKSLFAGLAAPLAFRLTKTRAFGNGAVLLEYVPAP